MSEVLMTNVFFVITGVAIVIASTMFIMVLYQVWRITRVLRRVSEKIEAGATRIAEDAAELKKELTSGKLLGRLIQFALSVGSHGFDAFIEHATANQDEDDEPKKKRTKVSHARKTTTKKAKKVTKMKIKNLNK